MRKTHRRSEKIVLFDDFLKHQIFEQTSHGPDPRLEAPVHQLNDGGTSPKRKGHRRTRAVTSIEDLLVDNIDDTSVVDSCQDSSPRQQDGHPRNPTHQTTDGGSPLLQFASSAPSPQSTLDWPTSHMSPKEDTSSKTDRSFGRLLDFPTL